MIGSSDSFPNEVENGKTRQRNPYIFSSETTGICDKRMKTETKTRKRWCSYRMRIYWRFRETVSFQFPAGSGHESAAPCLVIYSPYAVVVAVVGHNFIQSRMNE